MNSMRILFISPTNFGLNKPIEEELKRQGHYVNFIADSFLQHDNGYRGKNTIKKLIDGLIYNHEKIIKQHWTTISNTNNIFQQEYDLCLCINGCSLGKYFFERVKKRNPQIKCILYLWDTLNFFEYNRIFPFFDKIYSFDFNDSENNRNITFLPFYWVPCKESTEKKYVLSLIGSHHDNRLRIAELIAQQLDKCSLPYFIKIVCARNSSLTISLIKEYVVALFTRDRYRIRDIKILIGKDNHPLITEKVFSIEEMQRIIEASDCVLDTDMEVQAGPTPRLIWALAQGKKVITTNRSIIDMPLYDPNRISVIDRKKPIINIDFLKNNASYKHIDSLSRLRIDRWIEELIS